MNRVLQKLGRVPDDPGHIPRGVDYRVPFTALERREAAVPVADQLLDLGKQVGVGPTSVEERHGVPGAGQHATRNRGQRENMAGLDNVGGHCVGRHCSLNGACPVRRRNTGIDTDRGLNGQGEIGFFTHGVFHHRR